MPNFVDTIYALFPPILSWLKRRLCHFCVDQRWSEIFHIHFNFSISPDFTDDIFAGQHLSTCALRWLSTSSILVFFTQQNIGIYWKFVSKLFGNISGEDLLGSGCAAGSSRLTGGGGQAMVHQQSPSLHTLERGVLGVDLFWYEGWEFQNAISFTQPR